MLWLPSNTTAAVSPTPSATDWDGHVNSVSRQLLFGANGSALTTLAYAPDAGDDITDVRTMAAQFVSEIMPPQNCAADAISICLLCAEDDASNNLFLSWKLYACNVAGTSNLGNLIDVRNDGTEMVATTLTGRADITASLALNLIVPFRLCLEVGWDGLPTSGAGTNAHNASLRLGALNTGSFPQNASTTDVSPVVIFGNDIKRYATATPGPYQRGVMSGGMA